MKDNAPTLPFFSKHFYGVDWKSRRREHGVDWKSRRREQKSDSTTAQGRALAKQTHDHTVLPNYVSLSLSHTLPLYSCFTRRVSVYHFWQQAEASRAACQGGCVRFLESSYQHREIWRSIGGSGIAETATEETN